MSQIPLKNILAEIIQKCDNEAESKELLERTKEVLNGFDTLNSEKGNTSITAADVLKKIDNTGELSQMEKYLAMMKKLNN